MGAAALRIIEEKNTFLKAVQMAVMVVVVVTSFYVEIRNYGLCST